jgi:uncharacterized membrane protein
MLLLVAGIGSVSQGPWGTILGIFFIVAAVAWKIGGAVVMSKKQQQAKSTTADRKSSTD